MIDKKKVEEKNKTKTIQLYFARLIFQRQFYNIICFVVGKKKKTVLHNNTSGNV